MKNKKRRKKNLAASPGDFQCRRAFLSMIKLFLSVVCAYCVRFTTKKQQNDARGQNVCDDDDDFDKKATKKKV